MNNYSKISSYESYEFLSYVNHEKINILSDVRKNPCEIIIDVFDLCIDNFDGLNLEENQPELYSCLMQLYNANREKPLSCSLNENISIIHTLIEIFIAHKERIIRIDCQLYYALLNFVDFLKTHDGKHLYFDIVP